MPIVYILDAESADRVDLKNLFYKDYDTKNINAKCVRDYGDDVHSRLLFEINGVIYCFNCLTMIN